ncbi:hypothetical protein [Hymenobacter cellulosivorans]|uniref:Uncharacterized protein n=1 Tax=Hymenobacter cellulosivorans TaxID=2932249 RepID=A0ABY4FIX2_9BACT|nr:hypothetical protein [Hymenobacter cellulosivorans]UOQ54401.1 hypothetical protein MUN80_06480 [Hymenobacter cellulosivorans]
MALHHYMLGYKLRRPLLIRLLHGGLLAGMGGLVAGCAAVGRVPTLEPGDYQFLRTNDPALTTAVGADRALYVEQNQDSLRFFAQSKTDVGPHRFSYAVRRGRHVILVQRKFDLDVFTIPFKARPPRVRCRYSSIPTSTQRCTSVAASTSTTSTAGSCLMGTTFPRFERWVWATVCLPA